MVNLNEFAAERYCKCSASATEVLLHNPIPQSLLVHDDFVGQNLPAQTIHHFIPKNGRDDFNRIPIFGQFMDLTVTWARTGRCSSDASSLSFSTDGAQA